MTFRQSRGPAGSAAKAAISTATAYRFERDHRLPSSQAKIRGRRRPDPLVAVFDAEVVPKLMAAPKPRTAAIFTGMQRRSYRRRVAIDRMQKGAGRPQNDATIKYLGTVSPRDNQTDP